MKIKRFIATTMQEALTLVKSTLGDEAVIISNKSVQDGVEVIAAIDHENVKPITHSAQTESSSRIITEDPALQAMQAELETLRNLLENQITGLSWGDMQRRNPIHATLIKRYLSIGFEVSLAKSIMNITPEPAGDIETAWKASLENLSQQLPIADDLLDHHGVIALVGPTGVGKTTTIAKLAARFVLRYGSSEIAIVTTDSYRIAAHEQLRCYGQILNIPVKTANSGEQLQRLLQSLSHKRLVLIDSAGSSQRDQALKEHDCLLEQSGCDVSKYLVLSATSQYMVLCDVIEKFSPLGLDGTIITKLDETVSMGPALSAAINFKLPIAYLGTGQQVPEDCKLARTNTLMDYVHQDTSQFEKYLAEESIAFALGGE